MWRKPFPVAGALNDDLVAGVGQELVALQSALFVVGYEVLKEDAIR